jgi:hypothetical protein
LSKSHLNNSKLQFFRRVRIGGAGFLDVKVREKNDVTLAF